MAMTSSDCQRGARAALRLCGRGRAAPAWRSTACTGSDCLHRRHARHELRLTGAELARLFNIGRYYMDSGAVVKGMFAVSVTHALAHLLRPAQARLRWCAGALAEVAATCGRHLAAPAAWLRALRSYSAPPLRAFARGRLCRLAIGSDAHIQSGTIRLRHEGRQHKETPHEGAKEAHRQCHSSSLGQTNTCVSAPPWRLAGACLLRCSLSPSACDG